MKSKRINRGFSLVEVLVALLIFSIGMLGLAGLQLRAHQSSSYAQTRTIATLNASGLVERMRANLAGVTARDYEFDYGADGDPVAVSGCAVESGAACSVIDRATTDIAEWIQELGTSLPILTSGGLIASTADIVICRDSDPETQAGATPGAGIVCDNSATTWTVYVDWTDQRNVTTNQPVQRYSFTFVP